VSYEHIRVSVSDGIGRLTLARPDDRNAMTLDMGREIETAVAGLNADDGVRVVVIDGQGKSFSAGGNLQTLGKQAGVFDDGPSFGSGSEFYRAFLSVGELRVPSIAAINGHAIGAGLCFALACDLRVMHDKAKVGMTFVRLGIHPGMAATWNLPRLIGRARAADLLFTGRLVDAREAFELGLVNRVAGDDFGDVVDALARDIATAGPLAVRALKETLRGTATRTLDEAVEREAEAQAMTFGTEDAREGIHAIMEKRPPRFGGR
jgi:enoyl-CoA hydratase